MQSLRPNFPLLKTKSLDFVDRIAKNDIFGLSASIAYYTVLSLTPFLLLFFAVVASVGWQDVPKINAGITQVMGSGAGVVLESLQQRLKEDSGGIAFGVFGLLTLLFSASGVIAQLQSSLDTILHSSGEAANSMTPAKPPSFMNSAFGLWLKTRFYAVLALLFCIFTASVSLILSVVIELILPLHDQNVWNTINGLGIFAIFALIFTMMFRYLPLKEKGEWPMCIKGGIVCSLLFHLGKGALATYFSKAGFESSYGALSSFIIFLLWAYYNALIILLSAVIAKSFFTGKNLHDIEAG